MALPELPDWSGDDYSPEAILDGLQRMADWLRRLQPRTGGDVLPVVTASGTYWMGGGGGGLVPMVAPAGGLAAGSSATCTYRVLSGTSLVTGSATETVQNPTTNAVGASAKFWATRFGGRLFVVILESCP